MRHTLPQESPSQTSPRIKSTPSFEMFYEQSTEARSECVRCVQCRQSNSKTECPCSAKQGDKATWETMKHGGTATALSLVLAFAHHVRLCTPFSSSVPWQQSSRVQHSQAGDQRTAWALEAATSSDKIGHREDTIQAKRTAKDLLVAQRVSDCGCVCV